MLAWAVVLAAVVPGCRREPRLDGEPRGPGVPRSSTTEPAATRADEPGSSGGPAAVPAGEAGSAEGPNAAAGAFEERVPPVPSGWVAGTRFAPPPPVPLGDVPATSGFNFLTNAGFEDGTEPWWYFPDRPHWGGFTVTTATAREGRWSARLELKVDETHPPPDKTHIRGVIHDVRTPVLPNVVSGSYYVETWERGEVDTYTQFVVIVAGAAMSGGSVKNQQLRYLLAGIDHPPFGIANAKFVYVTREQPAVGQWVRFERNLTADFLEYWGELPERFENVRILFEVRYDNMDVSNPPRIHAVVHFDDLYLGT
ncbi:MAG: hypothetical protein JXB32_02380 [Deltaproteobacteria bacterium]|nr:hypothetical protein [Deltaproteobacteria bacterium]